MNKLKKTEILLMFLIVLVILSIFLLLFFSRSFGEDRSEKQIVGFISTGSSEEAGWNGMHIRSVKGAGEGLGVKLLVRENIKEYTGDCVTAAQELVDQGARLLLLNSYGYAEELKEFIARHPEVSFLVNNSETAEEENVSTYFVRMYQVRYLSGIIAGLKTKTGKIGYVAAMSNNEVNRGINAFTLGVKSVNPSAEVVVAWTNSWDDGQAEKASVHRMVKEKNIDLVTYHQNQPHTIDAAEEEGIYSIGYHQAFEGYSDQYLTSVMGNWESMYYEIMREYLRGHGNDTSHYWFGLEKEAVCLTEFSPEVSEEIRDKVQEAAERIRGGQDVFSGEIHDTEGKLHCREGESISDSILLTESDWFVDGVVFLDE